MREIAAACVLAPWEDPPEDEEAAADPADEELEEAVAVEELAGEDDESALAVVPPDSDPDSVEALEDSEEAVSPLDSLEDDSPEEAVSPAEADSPAEALSPLEPELSLLGPAEPNEPPEEVVVVLFRIVRL